MAMPATEPATPTSSAGNLEAAVRASPAPAAISGVGAGAVSAALGALAAEREASARLSPGFNPPVAPPIVQPSSESEPSTPVTLRSEAAPEGADAGTEGVEPAQVDPGAPDSEDLE